MMSEEALDTMRNRKTTPDTVGLSIQLPKETHRAIKIACAESGLTLNEAAEKAFHAWATSEVRRMMRTRLAREAKAS